MTDIDGYNLDCCPHCGGDPMFKAKENYLGYKFWRVVCFKCGCGTWCDENGFGHINGIGKSLAAKEWNERHIANQI